MRTLMASYFFHQWLKTGLIVHDSRHWIDHLIHRGGEAMASALTHVFGHHAGHEESAGADGLDPIRRGPFPVRRERKIEQIAVLAPLMAGFRNATSVTGLPTSSMGAAGKEKAMRKGSGGTSSSFSVLGASGGATTATVICCSGW
jgi:hypothetical protein